MKFAHVATKWIGEGTSDDKWRADMPEGYTQMSVLLDQYVNLAMDCPSPNVALVRIQESREKHEGYVDGLKSKQDQIVIETWEDDGPVVSVATPLRFKNFLKRQGMEEDMAQQLAEATVGRMGELLEQLDIYDKRARRRLELEV